MFNHSHFLIENVPFEAYYLSTFVFYMDNKCLFNDILSQLIDV